MNNKTLADQTEAMLNKMTEELKKFDDPTVDETQKIMGLPKKYWLRHDEIMKDLDEQILATKKPVIIIQGENDLKCPMELLKERESMYRKNPQVKIIYVPFTTHLLYTTFQVFSYGIVDAIWENSRSGAK